MRRSPATRRPGVTLLEVLGSTAIFLLSIVAISELMSLSTNMALEVQHRSRATRLCQSKLNEFATGIESLSGAASGEFEEEPGFAWQADIMSESSAANLYKVTVTVTRDSPTGPVEVSMSQYIFDPLQRGQLTGSTTTTTDPSTTGSGTTNGSSTGTSSGTGTGTTGGTGGGGGGRGGTGGGTGAGTGGGGTGGGKR
jgi:Tfp pilus assembly protein PilV